MCERFEPLVRIESQLLASRQSAERLIEPCLNSTRYNTVIRLLHPTCRIGTWQCGLRGQNRGMVAVMIWIMASSFTAPCLPIPLHYGEQDLSLIRVDMQRMRVRGMVN